jgi:hypothetical protein
MELRGTSPHAWDGGCGSKVLNVELVFKEGLMLLG